MAETRLKAISDWPSGVVLPKGTHLQEGVDALRELANASGYDLRTHHRQTMAEWKLAKIVSAGPNSEADYDDERYWLELQAVSDADPTDTLQIEVDDSEPYVDDKGNPSPIITGTNLSEWTQGTHLMAGGQLVWVRGKLDLGQPQKVHWAFESQPTRPIYVHLTLNGTTPGSNGSGTTNATYLYDLLSPDTGSPIPGATGLSPDGNREQGELTGPAGRGLARISPTGTWTLIWCDERAAITTDCPAP